ncbi:MAG: hypothetical protein A3G18_07175 [Rhodospirillales bacterium RIFCSPLOWO2_12_FULL_58_28]|nr:MAG: hypothetical protein A3H92_00825 [Rhodospirillales bacterium RIFCSPLOWO2_02_FULL_58_16]OHC79488.1 MAG: hypothetical protein A3G18_07175 [Rhodospirillales bacterium RIFCSPLOWO2_12_FULL_58_28]
MSLNWKVRLSEAAQRDFDGIFLRTAEHFGIGQARLYRGMILDALRALRDGPAIIGAGNHPELPQGVKTLHIARKSKRGRHFIVFDASTAGRIRVLRILHDAMDMSRHIEPGDEDDDCPSPDRHPRRA